MPGMFAIATYPVGTAATISVSASPEVVVPITVGLSSCFGYTTAGDIIRRALHHILVEATESTLQPDEYESGLDILNSYMAALESDGVNLGYQQVCNIADIVNVPNGAVRGIAANLAIDLAPQFGGRVTAALLRQAEMGLKTFTTWAFKLVSLTTATPSRLGRATTGQTSARSTQTASMQR